MKWNYDIPLRAIFELESGMNSYLSLSTTIKETIIYSNWNQTEEFRVGNRNDTGNDLGFNKNKTGAKCEKSGRNQSGL